jgi:hypothetical protein
MAIARQFFAKHSGIDYCWTTAWQTRIPVATNRTTVPRAVFYAGRPAVINGAKIQNSRD